MVKVLSIAILRTGTILVLSLIGTLFLYVGWNWGLVAALEGSVFRLHEIGFINAFWLSMCLAVVGGFFKPSVTMKD